MPVVKFQPPHLQSCGRITVASLEHKQVGRAAAVVGLATQNRRLQELLLSCTLVLSHFRPGGLSVAVRFALGAAGLCPGLGCMFPALAV